MILIIDKLWLMGDEWLIMMLMMVILMILIDLIDWLIEWMNDWWMMVVVVLFSKLWNWRPQTPRWKCPQRYCKLSLHLKVDLTTFSMWKPVISATFAKQKLLLQKPWRFVSFCGVYYPWKLTCPLKINGWKMYSLLKFSSLFRGHVNFQGCNTVIPFVDGSFHLFFLWPSVSIHSFGSLRDSLEVLHHVFIPIVYPWDWYGIFTYVNGWFLWFSCR